MAKEIPEPGSSRATVQLFREGDRTYEQKYVDCGKENCTHCNQPDGRRASHGPYWYLCVSQRGKWIRIYLGKDLDTKRFVRKDGRIDWPAVQDRRRHKDSSPKHKRSPKSQPDVVGRAGAPEPRTTPRGPAHIEKLEHEAFTARAGD